MLQDVPTMLGGRYRVVERLGRGGMADVYRAEDVVLRRDVAIKVFRGGVEREAHLTRFRAEVRTLARLAHPHLVALYDAGGDITEPWCAMEYVDGGSLGDLEEAVPPDTMARFGAHIAAALAYVHEQGIVHRDVKPSNVLLDSGGGAFLSDFGIARLIDGTRMTQSGLMIGTAAYLSPEQVRGQTAGPASDIYALALVMLEGLTGRREYPGAPVESAVARLSRSPEVPGELGADWAALLTRMTALDAADRPDARAVCAYLARIVARTGATITALEARQRPGRAGAAAGTPRLGEDDPTLDAAPAAPALPGALPPEDAATSGTATQPEGAAVPEVPIPRVPAGLPVVVLRPDPRPRPEEGLAGSGGDEPVTSHAPLAPGREEDAARPRGTAAFALVLQRRRTAVTLLAGAGGIAAAAALLPLLDAAPGGSAAALAVPATPSVSATATAPAAALAADDRQQVFRAPVTLPPVAPRRQVTFALPAPVSRTATPSASAKSPRVSPSASATSSGSASPTPTAGEGAPSTTPAASPAPTSATPEPSPTGR